MTPQRIIAILDCLEFLHEDRVDIPEGIWSRHKGGFRSSGTKKLFLQKLSSPSRRIKAHFDSACARAGLSEGHIFDLWAVGEDDWDTHLSSGSLLRRWGSRTFVEGLSEGVVYAGPWNSELSVEVRVSDTCLEAQWVFDDTFFDRLFREWWSVPTVILLSYGEGNADRFGSLLSAYETRFKCKSPICGLTLVPTEPDQTDWTTAILDLETSYRVEDHIRTLRNLGLREVDHFADWLQSRFGRLNTRFDLRGVDLKVLDASEGTARLLFDINTKELSKLRWVLRDLRKAFE